MERGYDGANSAGGGTNGGPSGSAARLPAIGYTALGSVLILEDHLPPPWQESASSNLPTLLLSHTLLAFLASLFRVQPNYAFPLSLAGLIIVSTSSSLLASHPASTGHGSTSSTFLVSVFTLLLLLSAPMDLLWLWNHLSSTDTRFIVILATMVSLLLKPLTLLTLAQLLRNQGVLEAPSSVGNNTFGSLGAASSLGAYWSQQRGDPGSNGGALGGGGGGAGGRPSFMDQPGQGTGVMPRSWSAAQPRQQQPQYSRPQPERGPSATAGAPIRPVSTASSTNTDRFTEGYQTYDSDEDDAALLTADGGLAIPGAEGHTGHGQQVTEADALPISASFAREAGFTTVPAPQQR
ncbi:hypothetical protein CF326_g2936 [Tilletia indica]|nr:hypothetical protein CF326_g2936 [Tilletia indica]